MPKEKSFACHYQGSKWILSAVPKIQSNHWRAEEHMVIVLSLQQRLEACFPGLNNGQTSEVSTHICTHVQELVEQENNKQNTSHICETIGRLVLQPNEWHTNNSYKDVKKAETL